MTSVTRWLDAEQLDTWLKFAAVVELLPGVLDSQLRRDADLTLFEYLVLAQLSEAPHRVLRMSTLAAQTNSTLPRLSHVVHRLEAQGLVERFPCPEDGRATNARLTESGWAKVVDSAPGHVEAVQHYVIDALTPQQVRQLGVIAGGILTRLIAGHTPPFRPTAARTKEHRE
jgi:DNA-binding MarR family transcriptional regulator